jgi:hypothetical protein
MDVIERARLAVAAAEAGDVGTAHDHAAAARQAARPMGRRVRQLVEIAGLLVDGDRARADGLALEHLAAFPGDAAALARVGGSGS